MGKGRAQVSDYCNITLIVLCPIICFVLLLVGYGVAKIVMGAVYLDDCKLENMVPVYLIVSGMSPLLFSGFCRKDRDESGLCGPGTVCGVIGFMFNFSWLICGSVWICPNYKHLVTDDFKQCEDNVTADCFPNICNRNLITFAFATVIIDWMFMCVWICFMIYLCGKLFCKY
ncbi:uncharacterized protein LOC132753956 [Ruditapes philippinarum]|uniref:uncharacterized protein LOC132753956 n=1 Tax=Ruditapes philippinarum TaxID=129788 RepID=UPI00295AA092|nr:uncharacterized protein LOC132753956 [Ruditapes philippinarum]